MIDREQVWLEFNTLSPTAQQQVLDFMAFLRTRHSQQYNHEDKPVNDLLQEPFVGMWQGREDMLDSNQWLRQVRSTEWD